MTNRKGFHAWREVQADEKPSLVRMLTAEEVARVLNVHPDTVRNWGDHGLVTTYRIGPRGDRRFRWEDINSFLECKYESRSLAKQRRGMVLIVHNDCRIADPLQDAVRKQGHEAVSVDSGERALEELQKQDFALIFLDLALLRSSGMDVLRQIKAKGIRAVVALVTGQEDGPIALEAMSLAPFFFIRKPLDMIDIIGVLHTVMGEKHEVSRRFIAG